MTTYEQRGARLSGLLRTMSVPFARAVSRSEAEAVLGRRGLQTALHQGALVRVLPDTYVNGAASAQHGVRCAAVLRWGKGDVLLTGASVLHLHDGSFPEPAVVSCVAEPHRRFRTPPWVSLRRRSLGAWTSAVAGQQCVPLEEAVIDAWRAAAPEDRRSLAYDVLWRRVVTARALGRAAASAVRVPERRVLVALARSVAAGDTSPAEAMARHQVFAGARWRALEWQVALVVGGRRRVADALHRAARVVVEFDGAAFHENAQAVRRYRERDAELAAAGLLTVRFSFTDLRDRPQWCRGSLARIIASRLPPGGT